MKTTTRIFGTIALGLAMLMPTGVQGQRERNGENHRTRTNQQYDREQKERQRIQKERQRYQQEQQRERQRIQKERQRYQQEQQRERQRIQKERQRYQQEQQRERQRMQKERQRYQQEQQRERQRYQQEQQRERQRYQQEQQRERQRYQQERQRYQQEQQRERQRMQAERQRYQREQQRERQRMQAEQRRIQREERNRRDRDRYNNSWRRPGNGYVNHFRPGPGHAGRPLPPLPPRPPRPPRPNYYYDRAPISFGLGLAYGSLLTAGVNALVNAGINIAARTADALYLNNIAYAGMTWPNATIFYNGGRMSGARYLFESPYQSTSEFSNVYNELCLMYGNPITVKYSGNQREAIWWGGRNSGYVTLRYSPYYDGTYNSYITELNFGQ